MVGPALVRQLSLAGSAPALARRGAAPAVAMLCHAVGDDVALKPLYFGVAAGQGMRNLRCRP